MEVNSQLYSQDSLAAEVLNKLQNGSGFSSVTAPEGLSLQHVPGDVGTAMLSASSPVLLPQSITGSADSIILNSAGALDPTLSQLLEAAQTGGSSTALVSGLAVSCPSGGAHALHPVLTATLPAAPSNLNPEMVPVPADHSLSSPAPVGSQEAMTITVHCTMSDTVIVVGQQNWQCCMCREICGLDTSIDQHLSLKHNLCLVKALEGNRVVVKNSPILSEEKYHDEKKFISPAEPLQTLSESALASLRNPDSGSNRSGLEREVALLMAQTFTHSAGMDDAEEDAKHGGDLSVSQEQQTQAFRNIMNSKNACQDLSASSVSQVGSTETRKVFGYMISKLERAILSTADIVAKNDLLLVSTELARMQKELTSKRRQMKKNHRYIPCPECGKEVRNRKDLIKQHNRCHEKSKKYRCLVCNKMFKYIHTLRRHVVQQRHQGGLPEQLVSSRSLDLNTSDFSVTEEVSFDSLKMDIDETSKESGMVVSVDLVTLSSEAPAITPESKEYRPQDPGEPAYQKILAALLSKGEQNRTATGRKQSLLQCFVCDREIRNRNYYITRHARCHLEDLCYTCAVCGVEFFRSDYYKDHMQQHGSVTSPKQDETSIPRNKLKPCEVNPKQSLGSTNKTQSTKSTTVSCKICNKQIFNRTYNIRRHVQQHSIVEWESIMSPSLSPSKTGIRLTDSSQHFLRCGMCGLNFQSYSRKRLHMLKHRCTFQCQFCGFKFGTGAELMSHSQSCKKKGHGTQSPGSGETAELTYHRGQNSCESANYEGVRGPTWKKQATGQVPSPQKWTCPICSATIIHTVPSISRHMRELHSEGQPHTCPECNRTYTSYPKMQRHLKSHGDLGGICDVCGKMFHTKAALRSHTKLHSSPEGMFQCPKCTTSFRFQSRLEKHMRKHADRTELCPHCGKVYISKVHLQRHISVEHMGIKDYRFKCDQCGAQFFENIQLRDHIAYRHKGIQIYTCKYCKKGFNCRPTLVRHERKEHTNYLPYKCKHCLQGFPEKSKLVAHEMTHTGMSPHKCEVCGKYFTTGGALREHKNLHLGVKPFECSVCGKTYLKNWHLQQHLRKVHHTIQVMVYNLPATQHTPQDSNTGAAGQPASQNQTILGQPSTAGTQNQPKLEQPSTGVTQNQPKLDQPSAVVSQNQPILGQPSAAGAQNQGLLPMVEQAPLQQQGAVTDCKFLPAASVQGDNLHVVSKEDSGVQQQQQHLTGPVAGRAIQIKAQTSVKTEGV